MVFRKTSQTKLFGDNSASQPPTDKVYDFFQMPGPCSFLKCPWIVSALLNCMSYSNGKRGQIYILITVRFYKIKSFKTFGKNITFTWPPTVKRCTFLNALFMLILKIYLTLFLAAKILKILQKHWGCQNITKIGSNLSSILETIHCFKNILCILCLVSVTHWLNQSSNHTFTVLSWSSGWLAVHAGNADPQVLLVSFWFKF